MQVVCNYLSGYIRPMPKEPRKDRTYSLTFDSVAEKDEYLAYAKRVHHLPLATLIKKWLADDWQKHEPQDPPKA